MNAEVREKNGVRYAWVTAEDGWIADVQTALDMMVNMRYETDCDRMAVAKSAFAEPFFSLRTGLLGEVLQKFVNYQVRLAVVGDFGAYTSIPLRDFIYESNCGRHVCFVPTLEEAEAWLCKE